MEIEDIRKEIDFIDDKILTLLAKRNVLVREISKIKKITGIQIKDEKREKEIINSLKEKAKGNKLNENFIAELYKLILENSKKEQEK